MTGRNKTLVWILTFFSFGWFVGDLFAQEETDAAPALTKEAPGIRFLLVMQVMGMPNVQEELKLTEDQLAIMAELRRSLQQRGRGAEARDKALAAAEEKIKSVLSPEQAVRRRQIQLQALVVHALLLPDVIETLELTQPQQNQLREIETKFREDRRVLAGTPSEERLSNGRQLVKETMATALAVLKPSQREKFEKLRGPEFDFSRRVPPAPGYEGRPPQAGGRELPTETPDP